MKKKVDNFNLAGALATCFLSCIFVLCQPFAFPQSFASLPESINYGQTLQRAILPSTDVDIFTFVGAIDDVVTIRVTRDSSLQPRVILKSPSGAPLMDRWGTDWVKMEYTLPQNGTYSIEVSSHAFEGNYTLVPDRLSPSTGSETVIDFGEQVSPYIWPIGGIVHYVFYAFGSDLVNLRVFMGPNWFGEAELWSPSGLFLGNATCSGYVESPLTTELGSAGWYHLIAHSGLNTGNFYMTLERNGKPLVETVLSGNSFHTGGKLQISLHMLNGPNPETVELRSWVEKPSGGDLVQVPHPATYSLAPWADVTIPVVTYTFKGNEPTGTYRVGARLLEPVSGYSWSMDESDTFSFSP